MKRILPILLVLLAIAGGAFWYLRNRPNARQANLRPAELAAPDTAVYFELPDFTRTVERWKETALHQMTRRLEWQMFAGPTSQQLFATLGAPELEPVFALLLGAEPGRAFLSFSGMTADYGKYVGGFSYRGKKSAVKEAIEQGRRVLLSQWTDVRSELVRYGETEIESVTSAGKSVALAYRDNWFFVAPDVAQMKELLQRYDGAAAGLAKQPKFAEAWKEATLDADFYAYLDVLSMSERLDRAMELGPKEKTTLMSLLPDRPSRKPTDATGALYSMRMEGRDLRGRFFLQMPGEPKGVLAERPSEHSYWARTISHAHLISIPALEDWWWQSWERACVVLARHAEMMGGAAQGMKVAEAAAAFSAEPELRTVPGTTNSFLAFEVRDREKATTCVEGVAQAVLGVHSPAGLVRREFADAAVVFQRRDKPGLAVALMDQWLVITPDYDLTHWATLILRGQKTNSLADPAFQALRGRLPAPASAAARADLTRPFQTVLPGWRLRITSAVAAANPAAIRVLPNEAFFSRHLGSLGAVYLHRPNGLVVESLGALPFEETFLASAVEQLLHVFAPTR